MPAVRPKAVTNYLLDRLAVSRETIDRLELYVGLLLQWQRTINLIGPKTIDDVWTRHILDCAQIVPLLTSSDRTLLDIGSGAGLPGMILAILTDKEVSMVESDQRKSVFLREAARACSVDVTIHAARIENLAIGGFDVVTARALAPLDQIITWAEPKIRAKGRIIALKGRMAEQELTDANEQWTMKADRITSITAPDAQIIVLREVKHGPSGA